MIFCIYKQKKNLNNQTSRALKELVDNNLYTKGLFKALSENLGFS